MSVYQVEEYYIHTFVPAESVDDVKHFLDNHQEMVGLDVSWDGSGVTIENFDSESRAEDLLCEILELV